MRSSSPPAPPRPTTRPSSASCRRPPSSAASPARRIAPCTSSPPPSSTTPCSRPAARLEAEGVRVTYLRPNRQGFIEAAVARRGAHRRHGARLGAGGQLRGGRHPAHPRAGGAGPRARRPLPHRCRAGPGQDAAEPAQELGRGRGLLLGSQDRRPQGRRRPVPEGPHSLRPRTFWAAVRNPVAAAAPRTSPASPASSPPWRRPRRPSRRSPPACAPCATASTRPWAATGGIQPTVEVDAGSRGLPPQHRPRPGRRVGERDHGAALRPARHLRRRRQRLLQPLPGAEPRPASAMGITGDEILQRPAHLHGKIHHRGRHSGLREGFEQSM